MDKEVPKDVVTVQAQLIFESFEEKQKVLDLMRRWSSCMRFAYQRLLEGYDRNSLKRELQEMFNLNSRYVDDAIVKAKGILESRKHRGEDPRRVVFGGRELFEKLKRRHINGKLYEKLKIEWQEKRKGNLNTRIVTNERGTFLRINVGERKYVYAKYKQDGRRIKTEKRYFKKLLHQICLIR